MLMVQDQYRQSSRKNFESQLHLKQNTSKQLFSDPQDIWEIESGCEEEILTSGNDSEQEDNILYAEPSDQPEDIIEPRRTINPARKKFSKNVRFEGSDFNYVPDSTDGSLLDNDYLGVDCEYVENEAYRHRRSLSQEPEITGHKMREPLRVGHKTKLRTMECGYEKKFSCGRRPKSSPEKSSVYPENALRERRPISMGEYNDVTDPRQKTRRKEHRCGQTHHEDLDIDQICGESVARKTVRRNYKPEYGDDQTLLRQRHGDCCDHCPVDEPKLRTDKKTFAKLKPMPSHMTQKHACHLTPEPSETEALLKTCRKTHRDVRNSSESHFENQPFTYHSSADRYCLIEDYCDHTCSSKTKKKILEAVQEQQEQFSDSTYKIPCPKYSSQTIPLELIGFSGKRSSEKLTNSSQSDWLYCSTKGNEKNSFGERLVREVQVPRVHKMRSRRTRMNRLKHGWKKAFVQTVRDGTRNERVGVIVMGPKGPEFYAKNAKPTSEFVPFRKSKSFLDGAAKSFEVMTVDCKNVFLSSSEPGPRTNYGINDLVCPEEDTKVEEKIAEFSKNMNEIVKSTEEKFYKALSTNELEDIKKPNIFKGAGEGETRDEKKEEHTKEEVQKKTYPPFHLLPFESLSPRIPKTIRKPEKKPNEESKSIADALNEQAKQYKESQSNLKDKEQTFLEGLKELQEKYPPKEMDLERAEANLSLWGMKLERMSEKTDCCDIKKGRETEEEETGNETALKKEINIGESEGSVQRKPDQEKSGKDDLNQSGSIKSNEQIIINKQRRKKYYETTSDRSRKTSCNIEEASCEADDPLLSKIKAEPEGNAKTNKRIGKWPGSVNVSLEEQNFESKSSVQDTDRNTISAVFRDLVENGCAISREESENLQNLFNRVTYNAEVCSNDAVSLSSSEVTKTKLNVSPRSPKSSNFYEESKNQEGKKEVEDICRKLDKKTEKERRTYYENEGKAEEDDQENTGKNVRKNQEEYLEDIKNRKISKMKNYFDEKLFNTKLSKKVQSKHKEKKSKKKIVFEDKMKLLRKTLPSIAAQNEAAHLKQLKKYIDRFIDRVEASTSSEFRKRKESRLKSKEALSTDSSEVKVDARKILDFVSNPFKRISSDVTINIAKKLTDALVQDKSFKNHPLMIKGRKFSEDETDEDSVVPWGATSGSDRCEDSEPTYLKQLKKMRSEHLNNIVLEVKKLSELLRFLDRCNRLNV